MIQGLKRKPQFVWQKKKKKKKHSRGIARGRQEISEKKGPEFVWVLGYALIFYVNSCYGALITREGCEHSPPGKALFECQVSSCIGQICPLHTPAFFYLEDLCTAQTFFNFDLRAEYFYRESSFGVSRMRRRLKSKIEPSVFSPSFTFLPE